jgi:hypothetical protein
MGTRRGNSPEAAARMGTRRGNLQGYSAATTACAISLVLVVPPMS